MFTHQNFEEDVKENPSWAEYSLEFPNNIFEMNWGEEKIKENYKSVMSSNPASCPF